MKQQLVRVFSIQELTEGVFLMWLETPEFGRATPGQFVMVHCGPYTVLRRPLSIYSAGRGLLGLLFQVRGKGTEWLSECEPGELLDVSGPIGSGFSILPATKNLLLVAGGIGIAPFVYVADKYGWGRKKVTLLAGAATKKQLFPNILPPQVEYIVATEDGSAGHRGMVTDLLPEYAPAAEQILACGPLPMYRHMAENPGRCGITGKSVQVSMEMRMACAMGVCYGCTIRTTKGVKQACKDGPVFRLDEIIWDDLARV